MEEKQRSKNNLQSSLKYNKIILIVFITIGLFFPLAIYASTVKTDIIHSQDRYHPDGSHPILFRFSILDSWYIHGPEDEGQGLIPTKLSFSDLKNIRLEKIRFPDPEKKKFDYTSEAIEVYANDILVEASIRISKKAGVGEHVITGTLSYQACSFDVCLPPETVPVNITVMVVPQGTPVKAINQTQFNLYPSGKAIEPGFPIHRLGAEFWWTLLLIFLGGLALNLTPCIYPLIPITVSYFGGRSEKIKSHAVTHGVLYLCGLATTNSILGITAALSGGMLGSALQNPEVLIIVSGIMIALAFSFFGFWEIRIPAFLSQIASRNYGGYFGTFFIGLTLGIVAAPCIGPGILWLLTYVGKMGDPFLGFIYFFILSIGMGLPLCILAVFSGSLDRLPRSGDWMVWVKRIMGWVLIGVAIYIIFPLIPYSIIKIFLPPIVFIAAGIQLGWLDKTGKGFMRFSYFKRISGTLVAAFGVAYLIFSFQPKEGIIWRQYDPEMLSEALKERRPVILDFFADWCLPCKELDVRVFQDERVVTMSKHFEMLRLDLTDRHPQQDEILNRYQVRGVPTVLFFNRDGIEKRDLRVESIVSSHEFLSKMEALRNKEPAT
ncbi:MAG: thioredoxin family protein [Deltaproteobacteria bacterium]|nr:thioredoxin family protein [Deltaproteobacteria bacterium]